MPFPALPILETPRLLLRPLGAGDLPDLLEVNGDPEVTKYLPYESWQTLADGETWLARAQAMLEAGTGQVLVLVRRSDAKVIGTLQLFRYDEGSRRAELGYVLGRAYWGQGLMREAIVAACTCAFDELGLRRIEAEVNPLNVASCALLERVGFTREGTLRERWLGKGGAHDTHLYGWLAKDRRGARGSG